MFIKVKLWRCEQPAGIILIHLHFSDNHKAVILDLVTQAGTYVKEFVHGEFNRTEPSISSIIGQEIDIVALDVNGIDLDWPNEVDNKLLSRQQKKRILIESATQ